MDSSICDLCRLGATPERVAMCMHLNCPQHKELPKMAEPLQLVTGKTDQEVASEIKAKLIAAYEPLLKIADEANDYGLAFQCQIGPNAFGKFAMTQLQIIKVFK